MTVGDRVALDVLEPPEDLVHQPADLSQVATHRENLLAEPVLDRILDPLGEPIRRGGGDPSKRFELCARPLEHAVERGSVGPLLDPLFGAVDGALVHTWQMYRGGRMRVDELDYDLPAELIAQRPQARRDESRLLVYERVSGQVHHRTFAELPDVAGGALVDQLVSVVAACTVIAYSLYTFTARDSKALMVTIPFVVFGVFRYLLLIHRQDLGEEPEEVLLRDPPILLCIAAWAVCAAVILVVT